MNTRNIQISINQNKEKFTKNQTLKKITEYIKDLFGKEHIQEQTTWFTDSIAIKTKKLSKETQNAETFIKEIFDIIKDTENKTEQEIIESIKKIRYTCQHHNHILKWSITGLKKEYPELIKFYQKEKTKQNNKELENIEDNFYQKDEIKHANEIKNQISHIEKIFQSLRMKYKTPLKKQKLTTMEELFDLLQKDVTYISKGKHKKRKAKIKNISPNWKNNEVIVELEIDKDWNNQKGTFGFATGFKGSPETIINEVNAYIDRNTQPEKIEKPEINRDEIYTKISRIVTDNWNRAKVIPFFPEQQNSTENNIKISW